MCIFHHSTDCMRDLGVFIDAKFNFDQQVDNIFCHAFRLLGLIRTVPFPISSLHNLLTLHYTLVRDKLEYLCVAWISDRLCGLVVRVSGYRYRGLGFDSRRYQIF